MVDKQDDQQTPEQENQDNQSAQEGTEQENQDNQVQEATDTQAPEQDDQQEAESASEEKSPAVSGRERLENEVKEQVEKCWNCAAQGVEEIPKLVDGVCEKCGFDVSKVHNPSLVAKQERLKDGQQSQSATA